MKINDGWVAASASANAWFPLFIPNHHSELEAWTATYNINRGLDATRSLLSLTLYFSLYLSTEPFLCDSFLPFASMATGEPESFGDKIEEKFHDHHSDSDSYSSDSDDGNKERPPPPAAKSNVYRLFGRDQPVHKVLGGGKRKTPPIR